jgi:hypothetical protein
MLLIESGFRLGGFSGVQHLQVLQGFKLGLIVLSCQCLSIIKRRAIKNRSSLTGFITTA